VRKVEVSLCPLIHRIHYFADYKSLLGIFLISMVFRGALRGFYSGAIFYKHMIIIQFFAICVKKDICTGIVKKRIEKNRLLLYSRQKKPTEASVP